MGTIFLPWIRSDHESYLPGEKGDNQRGTEAKRGRDNRFPFGGKRYIKTIPSTENKGYATISRRIRRIFFLRHDRSCRT